MGIPKSMFGREHFVPIHAGDIEMFDSTSGNFDPLEAPEAKVQEFILLATCL